MTHNQWIELNQSFALFYETNGSSDTFTLRKKFNIYIYIYITKSEIFDL